LKIKWSGKFFWVEICIHAYGPKFKKINLNFFFDFCKFFYGAC
jgi:hypothetical protein